NILHEMVRALECRIADLPLLDEHERADQLFGWNATQVGYPADLRYPEFVQAQIQGQPQALALCDEQEQLSYQQLWQRATHLAAHLQALGVQPQQEELLGLYMDRSVSWAVAVLVCLLTGGVYLPLDPAYPAGRLGYIVRHAG